MDKLLCQVCGGPTTDPETGRVWWVLVPTVFEEVDAGTGRTNAPPTCRDCIKIALDECPMLQHNATIYTVAQVEPAGVMADMYKPRLDMTPVLTNHNVFIAWDAFSRHPRTLATSQIVQLHGMEPEFP